MSCCCEEGLLDDGPPYVRGCFDSCKLAGLALMLAASITLQILACALYHNWWPMLTLIMYVLIPMPFLFFGGGSIEAMSSMEAGEWANIAKFLMGFSVVGSLGIPSILYHAQIIDAAAMCMAFASFFVLMITVLLLAKTLDSDY
ncbi:hypothetical protein GOP47_0017306 [Adiantum capillus-veneris]|uniref:Vacuolar protein sorting 55 n=1 Tax=Adiantum capillus-veneris TaxID=13818 RepID=A0A9D4UF17_ADICA|nr:hypothetical protein GOP47_0017306 [Adiantum capillus-veneris]